MPNLSDLASHSDATMLLRRLLVECEADVELTTIQLQRVLAKILWDADLACTALVMEPRPEWLTKLAGPRHLPASAV